jgi:hypothetical protein
MDILRELVPEAQVHAALRWVMSRSDHPSAELEPEFDIADDERRLAKKIRRLHRADPAFWDAWLDRSGLGALAAERLKAPCLIKHAAFIKRTQDESYIPLHQDIALWERPYTTATTFWVALTPATRANGGMFLYPDERTIFPHSLDIRYPMFKSIAEDEEGFNPGLVVDAELEAGDVLVWNARTAHGSHTNQSGQLRVGMPLVFVERDEFAGVF